MKEYLVEQRQGCLAGTIPWRAGGGSWVVTRRGLSRVPGVPTTAAKDVRQQLGKAVDQSANYSTDGGAHRPQQLKCCAQALGVDGECDEERHADDEPGQQHGEAEPGAVTALSCVIACAAGNRQ